MTNYKILKDSDNVLIREFTSTLPTTPEFSITQSFTEEELVNWASTHFITLNPKDMISTVKSRNFAGLFSPDHIINTKNELEIFTKFLNDERKKALNELFGSHTTNSQWLNYTSKEFEFFGQATKHLNFDQNSDISQYNLDFKSLLDDDVLKKLISTEDGEFFVQNLLFFLLKSKDPNCNNQGTAIAVKLIKNNAEAINIDLLSSFIKLSSPDKNKDLYDLLFGTASTEPHKIVAQVLENELSKLNSEINNPDNIDVIKQHVIMDLTPLLRALIKKGHPQAWQLVSDLLLQPKSWENKYSTLSHKNFIQFFGADIFNEALFHVPTDKFLEERKNQLEEIRNNLRYNLPTRYREGNLHATQIILKLYAFPKIIANVAAGTEAADDIFNEDEDENVTLTKNINAMVQIEMQWAAEQKKRNKDFVYSPIDLSPITDNFISNRETFNYTFTLSDFLIKAAGQITHNKNFTVIAWKQIPQQLEKLVNNDKLNQFKYEDEQLLAMEYLAKALDTSTDNGALSLFSEPLQPYLSQTMLVEMSQFSTVFFDSQLEPEKLTGVFRRWQSTINGKQGLPIILQSLFKEEAPLYNNAFDLLAKVSLDTDLLSGSFVELLARLAFNENYDAKFPAQVIKNIALKNDHPGNQKAYDTLKGMVTDAVLNSPDKLPEFLGYLKDIAESDNKFTLTAVKDLIEFKDQNDGDSTLDSTTDGILRTLNTTVIEAKVDEGEDNEVLNLLTDLSLHHNDHSFNFLMQRFQNGTFDVIDNLIKIIQANPAPIEGAHQQIIDATLNAINKYDHLELIEDLFRLFSTAFQHEVPGIYDALADTAIYQFENSISWHGLAAQSALLLLSSLSENNSDTQLAAIAGLDGYLAQLVYNADASEGIDPVLEDLSSQPLSSELVQFQKSLEKFNIRNNEPSSAETAPSPTSNGTPENTATAMPGNENHPDSSREIDVGVKGNADTYNRETGQNDALNIIRQTLGRTNSTDINTAAIAQNMISSAQTTQIKPNELLDDLYYQIFDEQKSAKEVTRNLDLLFSLVSDQFDGASDTLNQVIDDAYDMARDKPSSPARDILEYIDSRGPQPYNNDVGEILVQLDEDLDKAL